MDFKSLLKQAAANQSITEKRLEKEKLKEKELQAQEKLQKDLLKKKSAIKLKQHEIGVVKSRLSYHGLLSSSGQPLNDKAKKELEKVSNPPKISVTPSKTNNSHKAKSVSSSSSSTLSSKSTTSKSKSTSPRPLPSNTSRHKSTAYQTSKSQTPPPRLKPSKKTVAGPVNFQELLKLAQRNSKKDTIDRSCSSKPLSSQLITDKEPSAAAIGIGKALLNRQKEKKEITTPPSVKKVNQQEIEHRTKGSVTVNKGTNDTHKDKEPVPMAKKPNTSLTAKPQKEPQSNGRFNLKDLPYPEILQRRRPGGYLPSQQNHKTGQQGGTKVGPTKALQSVKSKSFYGGSVPSSARLITDGKTSSRNGPMYYKSVWVDEMRDYIRSNKEDYMEDDDEEEDLDDFVVDDGEDLDDYSSAIKSIFGYDRSQFVEDDDDALMESSYTQQEFEELRSARIGRMEDAEDIRKEQEMLARKRKNKEGGAKGGTADKKAKF